MPDANSSDQRHTLQNISLILLSILLLPLNTLALLFAYLTSWASPVHGRRKNARQNASFKLKTILVTGVGMTKGLSLARMFYEAGHNIIGADFEPDGAPVCGRVSKSLDKFYALQKPNAKEGSSPYIASLLELILREKVDLWVSCSGVASAVEDGEAKEVIESRTACKAIQFDVATTQTLHEKDSFIARTREIGLTVPETHTITNLSAVESALRDAPHGRKYIMKPIGMDDASRGDMTLLPKDTSEQTTAHLAKLKISEKAPWILQQYIAGPEYCTHTLVIRGQVKAFVACPSAELLMHYEALPSDSKLSQAMLAFTQTYAAKGGEEFTGHLSFDFMIEEGQMDGLHSIRDGQEQVLYPIECNPRAHTAVVLFQGTPGVADAYLSLLEPPNSSNDNTTIVTPQCKYKYYWSGHDLVALLIQPLLTFTPPSVAYLEHTQPFSSWRDGTWEYSDPAPWWWLYHVYWPMKFVNALRTGKKWSRVNVSTTKVFEC